MTASILSPLAQPFHPIMGDVIQPTIFNNGVPSLTVMGSESDFLHSIADETLDDAFPPTAVDAAELEDVEFFVKLMASLAVLEEREEAARTIHDGLRKRWQSRRSLFGKPRAAKHLIHRVQHTDPKLLDSKQVVLHDLSPTLIDNRMRQRTWSRNAKPVVSKRSGKAFGHKKPIQQPRKQS